MSKMQIVFTEFVDRTIISEAVLTPEGFEVDVIDRMNADETFVLNLKDLSAPDLESFLETIDASTFSFQELAYVWNIEQIGKRINLTNSYFRDSVSTERPLTEIDLNTMVKARFDVPGFDVNSFRELTLRYGSTFDPIELDALREIGIIIVSGNCDDFVLSNNVECKISFYKPAGILEKYIFNFDGLNKITTV